MDVESLAKELILKNMTPEQQMAVLDSVRQSVVEAKEVQKRKIGENVDLVVQALKKIETDIRDRFDGVGNAIEKRVASIKDGRDGINGKDGRDGKDGKSGKDGAVGPAGRDGIPGRDGVDGVNGVGITSARIDFDGSLIISLDNGSEINVGEVVAPDLAERIKVITNGGGTSQYVLDTLASLQTQITNLIPSQTGNSGKYLTTNGTALSWASIAGGGLSYQGTWNATTNTPTLASSTGTNGYYYITATAGSTNLDGITDWQIGDWLLFNGTVWQKIDQSNLVTSVAGRTGAITLSNTDISGLGTMSTQNASSVAITGGTATLTSLTTATVQATNSAGLNLKNSAGTTQLSMGAGGGDNLSLNVSTNINGTNAQVDISPTGTGHVHIKPTGVNSIEISPTYAGDMDNMIIGAVTPKNGSFVDLSVTGTTSFDGSQGTAGQVLTSAGTGATPTWTTPTTGTVTSVTGTSPVASSGGATPAISLASGYGDTQNPYASKTANFVLAAPNGSSGAPTFRAIVAADIPTLNQNTTGNASNVTGTVAVANGGTGQTSYTNGQLLIGNTTGNTLTKATLTAGTGVTITNGSGSITIAASGSGATATTVSDTANTSTGAFQIPQGTTAQRPGTPTNGMIRINTSNNTFELYSTNNTSWNTIGSFPNTVSSVEYLVVGGGGGAASGGAGAGGYRTASGFAVTSGVSITVTVGAGGTGGGSNAGGGTAGSTSTFSTIDSSGGGKGGTDTANNATTGGSGGGGGASVSTTTGAAGNSGSYTPVEGYAGGGNGGFVASPYPAGGGGGSSAVGGNATGASTGGNGGAGTANSISGSSVTYGGGGGGGVYGGGTAGTGGAGGGGGGNGSGNGTAGTANTGGGGGGCSVGATGGAGGSGIVIVRYADSFPAATSTTGSPTITVSGGYRVYKWTSSGSITF
jgi:hypothetical protein